MHRGLLLSLLLTIWTSNLAIGQNNLISGTVTDSTNGEPLAGATVRINGSASITFSASDGSFRIPVSGKEEPILVVSYLGYREQRITAASNNIVIRLAPKSYLSGEVTVTSTRLVSGSPMSFTDVSREDIEKLNTGRDIPYLLENTPSLVTTSDAGTGIGYTGIRIRGSDPTRINVTINGIPINDAESQGMYWVDLPDLASSVEDIQIQRGVGTSVNGAGAFGGSVNIQTSDPDDKPYAESGNSFGSFNTIFNNIIAGTGLLDDHWKFETRLSRIKSDGYVDRATADLKSFYFTGGYYGERDILKFVMLSGKEITYQSWYGVPEAALDTNRTFNFYDYEDQVDDYQQDHYQLFYTRKVNNDLSINTALHYTYGRGYFEEFRTMDDLGDYNVPYPVIGNDTIYTSDLVRRRWLDNDFYGITASADYKPNQKLTINSGIAWNQYRGDHFGEIIWAQYASTIEKDYRYYDFEGNKDDINGYVKANFKPSASLTVFADIQVRNVQYEFTGLNENGAPLPDADNLTFFNPKAGITYFISTRSQLYASYSVANKEPSGSDYRESTPKSRPVSENLQDLEFGFRHNASRGAFGINLYYMMYRDQLVLTGEVNDVGNYTRTNIDKSYRAGIEFDGSYNIHPKVRIFGNLTLSRNRIEEFNEFIDDYDNGGQVVNTYDNSDIAFSPGVIGAAGITTKPARNLELSVINKFVGDQYLDNTSNEGRSLDAYNTTMINLIYRIFPRFMKEVDLTFLVNNVFDREYESNGYTFSYIFDGQQTTENYFYPQAGINFQGKITLKF